MNSLTEIVFVLDRSGSMHGMEEDTIGGFNSMLEQQKAESGELDVQCNEPNAYSLCRKI